jgi:hypothetical protein
MALRAWATNVPSKRRGDCSRGGVSGDQVWDLKTDKGDNVASGIYLYVVTDGNGRKRKGKVAVVK